MTNRLRGEVEAVLDGAKKTLCLTLGGLAELESTLGADNLAALAARFESGHLAASDAIKILGAGLRAGGNDIADEAVAQMKTEGGAPGFVKIVGDLLSATFGTTPAAEVAPKREPAPANPPAKAPVAATPTAPPAPKPAPAGKA